MVAFSERPERKTTLTMEARMAIDLADAYLNGHLPSEGGWLDQDSYYVRLINLALSARTRRRAVAERNKSRKWKLRRRR